MKKSIPSLSFVQINRKQPSGRKAYPIIRKTERMNDLVDLEEKVIMEELNFDEKEKTYGKV